MELADLLIFLSLNIILLAISINQRANLYNILGMLFSMFFLTLILTSPLIIDHVYVVNNTGIVTSQAIYANPTSTIMIFVIMFLIHFLMLLSIRSAIIKEMRKGGK